MTGTLVRGWQQRNLWNAFHVVTVLPRQRVCRRCRVRHLLPGNPRISVFRTGGALRWTGSVGKRTGGWAGTHQAICYDSKQVDIARVRGVLRFEVAAPGVYGESRPCCEELVVTPGGRDKQIGESTKTRQSTTADSSGRKEQSIIDPRRWRLIEKRREMSVRNPGLAATAQVRALSGGWSSMVASDDIVDIRCGVD